MSDTRISDLPVALSVSPTTDYLETAVYDPGTGRYTSKRTLVSNVGSTGGVSDGAKGDITVSGFGAVWTIPAGVLSAFGRTITAAANAAAARTVLGLGTLATQSGTSSGTNTGDQTITLTGDVGGTGTGSFVTTIAPNAVTNAKAAQMAAHTFKGNNTGLAANALDLTTAQVKADLAITNADVSGLGALATASTVSLTTQATGTLQAAQMLALTGDVTNTVGTVATTIAANTVTNAKFRQGAATSVVGVTGNATANVADIAGTANQTLRVNGAGTALAFGALDLSQATAATGVLQAASMPALTGDVTNTSGTLATTIAAAAVTLAKMANVATGTVFYRKTAATGVPEVQTLATLKTDLGLTGTNSGDQTITLTGDVGGTGTGSFATTIAAAAVNLAKMANLAANSVIGNNTGSAAVPAALTLSPTTAVSSVVSRDASANTQSNNTRQGYTTTATAGGTTALTVTSTHLQFFTGTLAQTVTLPDVTTLVLGHQFYIRNSGTGIVTVNSSGGNLVRTIGPNTRSIVTCILITGITAASWTSLYVGIDITDGKVLSVTNNLTLSGTDGTIMTFPGASDSVVTLNATQTLINKSIVATQLTGTLQAAQEPAHTGDVTNAASSLALTIAANAVTNAKLATAPANTFKSNNTASVAVPTDITAAQAKTLLAITSSDVSGLGALATLSTVNLATQATGTLPIANGGTAQTTAILARGSTGLAVENYTGTGDTAYTILATDQTVGTSAAFTLPRIWTLPAANAVNKGQQLFLADFFGTVTSVNTITIMRAGTDTVNGGLSATINVANGAYILVSDGVSKWTAQAIGAAGTSGVSSFGGVTGAIGVGYGLTMTGATLSSPNIATPLHALCGGL